MRRAALIAALSVGSLFNLFDLDQDAAMVQATEATDTDDDIIREELARRHEFDKQYRKAIARLVGPARHSRGPRAEPSGRTRDSSHYREGHAGRRCTGSPLTGGILASTRPLKPDEERMPPSNPKIGHLAVGCPTLEIHCRRR